jgi:hypothetical protein
MISRLGKMVTEAATWPWWERMGGWSSRSVCFRLTFRLVSVWRPSSVHRQESLRVKGSGRRRVAAGDSNGAGGRCGDTASREGHSQRSIQSAVDIEAHAMAFPRQPCWRSVSGAHKSVHESVAWRLLIGCLDCRHPATCRESRSQRRPSRRRRIRHGGDRFDDTQGTKHGRWRWHSADSLDWRSACHRRSVFPSPRCLQPARSGPPRRQLRRFGDRRHYREQPGARLHAASAGSTSHIIARRPMRALGPEK